jgi:hypothetical protein
MKTKKLAGIALAAALIAAMTGCAEGGAANATVTGNAVFDGGDKPREKINGEDYVLSLGENPVCGEVEFIDNPWSGIRVYSYEELMNDSDRWYKTSSMNLVKFEIIEICPNEEAVKITGSDYFSDTGGATLYKAKITYDYLNQKNLDIEVYLSKGGNDKMQFEYSPQFVIGQRYISNISWLEEFLASKTNYCGINFYLTFTVYEINGAEIAYYLFNHLTDGHVMNLSSDKYVNLDLKLMDGEEYVITSAKNNPVRYVQKSTVEDLTDFIREDWTERGFRFYEFKESGEN